MLTLLASLALATPTLSVSEATADGVVEVYLGGDPGQSLQLFVSSSAPGACQPMFGGECLSLRGSVTALRTVVLDGHGRHTERLQLPAATAGRPIAFEAMTTAGRPRVTGASYRVVGAVGTDDDGDGLSDAEELAHGSSDTLFDTDGDGIGDGEEVYRFGTDPTVADPFGAGGGDIDGDGLSDADEFTLGTDAWIPDTDGDGLLDGDEVHQWGTDPLLLDTDGDGLTDHDELFVHQTDPVVGDTDGGGASDGDEVTFGTDPFDRTDDVHAGPDTDNDGLIDSQEFARGTDAWIPDTDGDGLLDGDEVWLWGTDPLSDDSDGDGLTDHDELFVHSTHPMVADTDGGGAVDGDEVAYGTDPFDGADDVHAGPDIDGDGLIDSEEFARGTDAWIPDTDGDGLLDGDEVWIWGTDPLHVDTDGGGVIDGDEVASGGDPLDPADG
jgi:hypothetical protein